MCNPNAGFICRLLAFHKDIQTTSAPEPARAYRMCPFVGGPVARSLEEGTKLSYEGHVARKENQNKQISLS